MTDTHTHTSTHTHTGTGPSLALWLMGLVGVDDWVVVELGHGVYDLHPEAELTAGRQGHFDVHGDWGTNRQRVA